MELIPGFEPFCNAFGTGQLGGNKLDLFVGLPVNFNEVLRKGVFHKHQRESVGLILLQILLAHSPESPNIPGRLGRECKVGVVIVSVFGVGGFHVCILLFDDEKSIADDNCDVEYAKAFFKKTVDCRNNRAPFK